MKCELDLITVHYEVFGSGTPILLLHGFSCDRRLMMGCMEPIFSRQPGWKRIYIDLPGMGMTKEEDWINSSDDMLDVIDQFVEKVLREERFLLAGESYGGYLSKGLLTRRFDQIDGLLLICPSAGRIKRDAPPFTVIAQDDAFLKQLDHEQKEEFTAMQVVQDAYNWARFQTEILSGIQVADHAFLERIEHKYDLSSHQEVLDQPYEKPVLIMTGRQDHVVGYRNQWELANEFPRASFILLDRAGHNLQIEQNHLFNSLVQEWLDRVVENKQSR
ncbi:alpha/beta fold hydrolase [Paenibacillus caui]|uniref:alpha/beta fold hydrolase n=1 Tax=Paenibacillus caui TaxID=2873927 RepID=UPI001CA81236|nr:alpha/beta hydrolase [Paenibacillus caui]